MEGSVGCVTGNYFFVVYLRTVYMKIDVIVKISTSFAEQESQ